MIWSITFGRKESSLHVINLYYTILKYYIKINYLDVQLLFGEITFGIEKRIRSTNRTATYCYAVNYFKS